MAGDADLRCLLRELRSVLPSNSGLGLVFPADRERMHYIGVGGARSQKIKDPTRMYRKALRRILEYEENPNNSRCYFNDFDRNKKPTPKSSGREAFRIKVDVMMPAYVKQKQKLFELRARKAALQGPEIRISKMLREQAKTQEIEVKDAFVKLTFAVEDFKSGVESNKVTPSQTAVQKALIKKQQDRFDKAQLELRVFQSAFRGFKRFYAVENSALKQAKDARNKASDAYEDAKYVFDPLKFHKQELDALGKKMYGQDLHEYNQKQSIFARASQAKYFFANSLERLENHEMGKLLDALEKKHATKAETTEEKMDALYTECRRITDEARATENERAREHERKISEAKADKIASNLKKTRLDNGNRTVEGGVIEDWELLAVDIDLEATGEKYHESFDEDGFAWNAMGDSDEEEVDKEDDKEDAEEAGVDP